MMDMQLNRQNFLEQYAVLGLDVCRALYPIGYNILYRNTGEKLRQSINSSIRTFCLNSQAIGM